jgi:hypothetical protein
MINPQEFNATLNKIRTRELKKRYHEIEILKEDIKDASITINVLIFVIVSLLAFLAFLLTKL